LEFYQWIEANLSSERPKSYERRIFVVQHYIFQKLEILFNYSTLLLDGAGVAI
jgi:hypothetical protein